MANSNESLVFFNLLIFFKSIALNIVGKHLRALKSVFLLKILIILNKYDSQFSSLYSGPYNALLIVLL